MANASIPGLPVAITLDGTEQLEVVQPPGADGTTKRATAQQIANLALLFTNNLNAQSVYGNVASTATIGTSISGSAGQSLIYDDTGQLGFGRVDLSTAVAVTGVLPVGFGGSGTSVASAILYSNVADQTVSGGAIVTPSNLGTASSGTTTLDMGARPLQLLGNNGAFVLLPGTNNGAMILDILNGTAAGAIGTAGWTFTTGDAFTTASGSKFRCHCSVVSTASLLVVQAMQ